MWPLLKPSESDKVRQGREMSDKVGQSLPKQIDAHDKTQCIGVSLVARSELMYGCFGLETIAHNIRQSLITQQARQHPLSARSATLHAADVSEILQENVTVGHI